MEAAVAVQQRLEVARVGQHVRPVQADAGPGVERKLRQDHVGFACQSIVEARDAVEPREANRRPDRFDRHEQRERAPSPMRALARRLNRRHAEAREYRDRRQHQPSPSRHVAKAAHERQRLRGATRIRAATCRTTTPRRARRSPAPYARADRASTRPETQRPTASDERSHAGKQRGSALVEQRWLHHA